PQSAFIIERGDGTESRVLTHYTLPDGFDIIRGPGWSPSGRWFAWSPAIAGAGTFASQLVTVISRDGQHIFPILEGKGPVDDLSWSPVDDLLMVQLHRVDGTFEMFIFDPTAGKVLVSEATVNGSYVSYDPVIWLPDGRFMESVSNPDGPPTR